MDFFQSILKESSVLYSNQEIHLAIKNIAKEINRDIQTDDLFEEAKHVIESLSLFGDPYHENFLFHLKYVYV